MYLRMKHWMSLQLIRDRIEELPWEGIGCWNPVFPALGYDMYIAASVAVQLLTKLIVDDSKSVYTCVFGKKYGMDGLFSGYERI